MELNDKAVKTAKRRIAEIVQTACEQTAQAERELMDAAQTVNELESQLDEVTAKSEDLDKRLADVQAKNQAQAIELAQLRERLAATEQTARIAGEQHADEIERMTDTIQTERAEHQQAIEQLRTELDQVRDGLATAKAEAAAAAQEAHRTAERCAHAEIGKEEARKDAGTAREEAAKLRGQVEVLQAQTVDLMKALGERQELATVNEENLTQKGWGELSPRFRHTLYHANAEFGTKPTPPPSSDALIQQAKRAAAKRRSIKTVRTYQQPSALRSPDRDNEKSLGEGKLLRSSPPDRATLSAQACLSGSDPHGARLQAQLAARSGCFLRSAQRIPPAKEK